MHPEMRLATESVAPNRRKGWTVHGLCRDRRARLPPALQVELF